MRLPIIATITSKRQLTIPAPLFRKLNWKAGMKVMVDSTEERYPRIIIRPAN
jgi:AbrB family looped-hinge helix DNA binding protein